MTRKLRVTLDVDSKSGVASVNKVTKSVNDMDKKTQRAAKNMSDSFKGSRLALISLGTAIAATAYKMVSLSKNVIDYGDKLNKLNKRLGVSVKMMDKLRQVSALAGINFRTLTNSIQRTTVRVQEAATGVGLAKDALEILQIPIEDLINLSPEEQFLKIGEAIGQVTDKSLQNKLAFDIMGRSGADLLSLFPTMREELKKVNAIMDGETADAFATFNDNIETTSTSIKHLITDALKPLVKWWNKVADANSAMNQRLLNTNLDTNTDKTNPNKYLNDIVTGKSIEDSMTATYNNYKNKKDIKTTTNPVNEEERLNKIKLEAVKEGQEAQLDSWRIFYNDRDKIQSQYWQTLVEKETAEQNEREIQNKAHLNSLIEQAISANEVIIQTYRDLDDAATEMGLSISNTFEDTLKDSVKSLFDSSKSFSDIITNMLDRLSDAFLDYAFTLAKINLTGSSGGGFDIGSIFSGISGLFGGGSGNMASPGSVFSSPQIGGAGTAVGFATGGIVTSPTNALIGEAGMNEAVVPLPDGRSIPIEGDMGGGATNIYLNINAMDSSSFTEFARSNPEAFSAVMSDLANRGNSSFRQSIRKASR